MQVSMGTVIGGQIVLDDGSFQEGARVVVMSQNHSDDYPLSPEERAELLAAIAEADRGDMISGAELFERLARIDSQ